MAKETRNFLRGGRADIVRVGVGGADRQLSKTIYPKYECICFPMKDNGCCALLTKRLFWKRACSKQAERVNLEKHGRSSKSWVS